MTERTWTVEADSAGVRLDKFLAASDRLRSRSRAADALGRGKVFLNNAEATAGDLARRLVAGDQVRFWEDRPGSASRRTLRAARSGELPIVYEDDALIVVNKPAGLLTVPLERQEDAWSVQDELAEYLRPRRGLQPRVVHRIDRDTSGLVLFAIRGDAQIRLKDQFRRHEPERVYLAVVYGHLSPESGTWRDHLVWDQRALIQKETHPGDPRGSEAQSHYRQIERLRGAALVEVSLVTGRRNQIRLQARLRGHTLVGEQRYIYGPDDLRGIAFPRQALHAHRLSFLHPLTGQPMTFTVPVPMDMAELIASLRR